MSNTPIFTGAGVAIVTPFDKYGNINYDKLGELIERQIAGNTDAIIICGTTGESAALDAVEHIQAVKYTVEKVNKRVPVIAGTGSNDTAFGVKISNEAEKAGADALLMVTPYYNKTSQSGLIRHYNYIADRVSAPIILYNVPSRTGVNIKPETYAELCQHERIVATKEANGDIAALAKTIRLCGDKLDIYCGNDDQTTAFMALGAKGVISVLSNVCPEVAYKIASLCLEGDIKGSAELQIKYLDLINKLFMDVNPIPVKEAMNLMGFDCGECRMPLAPLVPADHDILVNTLKQYNII
ncbi:MAG: 4-hydroxy-tetrahydrodipicolinate synthase [Oscillospiraceae bacterium]|nr:4-hydroxy-tetrahydrodipicolinate synthase [Oscillospiraceae bacterium]